MRRYDAVLWDADDTLFDYGACERAALLCMFERLGLRIADREAAIGRYRQINDALWVLYGQGGIGQAALSRERFARLLAEFDPSADVDAAAEEYLQALGGQSRLFPQALAVVSALHEAGVPQAVVTNGVPLVQRARLSASPIARYMGALVISGEEGVRKPDAAMFTRALARLSYAGPPGRALMVGDYPLGDVLGSQAAGLRGCWYNPSGRPFPEEGAPAHTVSSLLEVVDIVLG